MTDAEKAIYDTFEKDSRAVLDAARTAAKAIGADINAIIGPTEAAIVKVEKKTVQWLDYLLHFLDFLDDPRGKFSYKRGSGVAALVTSIIFAFKGDAITALIYFGGAVVIAIVCGLTKT